METDHWEIRPRNGGFDANAAMADDPVLHGVEYETWVPIMRREITADMVEAGASALALEDDYNPNDYDPKRWSDIRDRYEALARIVLSAALGREQP